MFYTQVPSRPRASAVGIHAGRIVSLDHELEPALFDEVYDLRGATVVPGFNDAHCHLTYIGQALSQVDLRPTVCRSMDALLAAVGAACAAAGRGAVVQGAGYDQNHLGGEHPTAEQLDAVSQAHPVWLVHNSRHMGVANTALFEAAGFADRRGAVAPEGGLVPLDAQGRAVGLLQETAQALVTAAIPAPSVDDLAAMVDAGSRKVLSLGITSISEPGLGAPEHLGMSVVDLAGYQLAKDTGRLGVRATVMPYLTTLHALGSSDGSFGLDLGIRTGLGDEWLRLGPVKILSDGSLIGRSAFMSSDYHAAPDSRGFLQFRAETLREMIVGAHRAGWQVAAHAIGDAALDVVLDIFQEAQRLAPRPDARHRIEHLSVASDAQIRRVVELGLVPVPQGRFIFELGDGVRKALGPERTQLAYRVRSLVDAGLEIPASTDAPVVEPDPIQNIDALVNRRTAAGADFGPEERISVEQAIRAYTVGSAYANHDEHHKGTLAPGMLADLAVLSEDLHQVPVDQISQVTVTATVVSGHVVSGDLP
ncbi:MAG: amidohydrolase [Microlunatus sp.]|nr:amidohydrolase [Microlunatus sp.]MDN5769503.1 amidohydrolase [Microlunatus sp.]